MEGAKRNQSNLGHTPHGSWPKLVFTFSYGSSTHARVSTKNMIITEKPCKKIELIWKNQDEEETFLKRSNLGS